MSSSLKRNLEMIDVGEGGPRPTDFDVYVGSEVKDPHELKLYIAGMTQRSINAIASIKQVCDQHLEGRYSLQVVDIYQHPELAQSEQILAVPALVQHSPAPARRITGDLANEERVLRGLGLTKSMK